MKLSKRLDTVLMIMQDCRLLADIGCDHGYICIEAVKNKKAVRAIAADTAKEPLLRARQNIETAGLSEDIRTVLSDGFKSLDKEQLPDCVNITGMGGRLITRILREGIECGTDIKAISQLILGPQSETEILRHYIVDELGLFIEKEYCIFDDGKYYMLMDVKNYPVNAADIQYSEADYLYGKNIAAPTAADYEKYLADQETKLKQALTRIDTGRKTEENHLKKEELKLKLQYLNEKAGLRKVKE